MIRSCAVCGASDKTMLIPQPLVLPEGPASYGGYFIVSCERCGFVFADETFSQEDSDAHYAGPTKVAQDLAAFGDSDADILRLENTASLLLRFVEKDDRLLDVGCGTGRLIWLLKQRGIENVSGIDQSPIAASIGRETYMVDVNSCSIFDFDQKGIDFVVISHVLEHIVDLSVMLVRLYDILVEGGRLYIEVPDVTQFMKFTDPRASEPWVYVRDLYTHFAPEHVNFFSPTSLKNLVTRFGFKEQYCASEDLGVIASVWEKPKVASDAGSSVTVLEYAKAESALQSDALVKINDLISSQQEVLVWGAGLHTQRLLANGGLDRVNIRAFIDSDVSLAGSSLCGRTVISPSEISTIDRPVPILISSWKGQSSILDSMQAMKLENPAFILYPYLLGDSKSS